MNTETRTNGARLDEEAKAVEAGLARHLRVQGELAEARQIIAELREQLTQAAVENESLRSFNNLLESRVNACIAERDAAVVDRARYESRIAMISAALREPLTDSA